MKLIKPVVFQPSQLISTTATEVHPAWNSATTYSVGQKAVYSQRIYESLVSSNLNVIPTSDELKWLDFGPANKYAMFDTVVGTATTATTSMQVVVKPGAIVNSVALINSSAAIVKLTVRDGLGGAIVYEETAGFSSEESTSWYDYFFNDPLVERTQIVFQGLPPYANAHLYVEFSGSVGSEVSCGVMTYGNSFYLGGTQYGMSSGITDYSVKETDEFGDINFVERAYSKRLSVELFVERGEINRVQRTLYDVRAKPSVWIASDDPVYEEVAVIYGYYKDFSTIVSYPTVCMVSIEIESLT